LRVGFFGTARAHKGIGRIHRFVEQYPDTELHVFAKQLEPHWVKAFRVVEHDPSEPIASVYASIDVALIPQDSGLGADVQLPAKLIDALGHGVPVVATRTPAVHEVAGDAAVYVDDWSDLAGVRDAVESALRVREALSTAGWIQAETHASIQRLGSELRMFVEMLVQHVAGPGVRGGVA
jgi:glycosyltransferase involved in cell wall biosynthesis